MCLLCNPSVAADKYLASLDQHVSGSADGRLNAPFTLDQIAGYLTNGYWNDNGGTWRAFSPGVGKTITYDIANLGAQAQTIAVAALQSWSEATGINFVAAGSAAKTVYTETSDAAAYLATSFAVAQNSRVSGSLAAGDVDSYRVSMTAGETYMISLAGKPLQGTLRDPVLELHDNAGAQLSLTDDSGPDGGEYLIYTATYTGDHYISASAFQSFDAGTYTLEVGRITADIIFNDQDSSGAYSFSDLSGNTIQRSYINIADDWDTLNLNGYMLQSYIHEIGHALGLGHAGFYDGSAAWGVDNHYDNESWAATIMSYFDQGENPNVPASFAYLASIMPADVIAIQSLYGAANTTNTGNTTYGYNSTMGGALQDLLNMWTGAASVDPFVYDGQPIAFTIIDSTGIDTINFSNFGVNQEITLIELSYSDIGGLIDNVAIARGAVIENATSGAGNDRLIGNAVANVLSGGAGNDSMDGAAGNDTFVGGTGGDAMNGGEGQDRAQYTDANAGLRADLQAAQFNTGFAAGDTYAGIEDLYGSSFGDTLLGNTGNNIIWGDAGDDKWLDGRIGNDTLYGGAGNDVLVGGWGTDVLDGGVGSRDRAQYTDATAGLRADLQVTQFNTGIAAGDTYIGIEDLYGSFQGDTLLGDTGNNIIWGDAGDDKWLDGRIGNDTLYGGAGNDVLVGGQGADVLDGGVGSHDRAQYADANAGLRFDLQSNAANTGFAAGDTYTGIEDIYGSFFGDTLSGDAGANMIWGAAGNDLIDGRLGNDVLIGGAGQDTLTGGGGADVFLFESATGTTNVDSVTDYVVADDTVWLDDAIFAALTTGALSAAAFVTGSAATTASHRILYDAATGQLSYDADGTGATGPIHFATLSAGLAMTAAEFLVS